MPQQDPVLLIEFVNADQFPGRVSYLFPVVSGYYRRQGCPVRWVRFAVSTTHLLEHQRDEFTLTEQELAGLLRVVDEHAPKLVIMTDPLHAPQMQALAQHAPGATFERIGADGQDHLFSGERRNVIAEPGFVPYYDWEPGNEAGAARETDNIYLLLTGSCGHWGALRRNPVYCGIDDPRLAGRVGCAFCQSRRGDREPGFVEPSGAVRADPQLSTPLDWVRTQIQAVARCRGPDRMPNALLLEQLGSAPLLRACIETMCACGMAGRTQLLLAVRADRVASVAEVLQEHFAREDGLKIGIYATGIESFSGDDLLLFNKGTTPLDSLRVLNTRRELTSKYPDRFWFSGISLLLFTPWTTPDSLALNTGILRALRVTRSDIGNMFQSRLRLHDDLPLTILAEREGLLVDDEPDPVLIMNRRKLFSGERPWRFQDPRIRPLCRIVLRFDLLHSPLADPLARSIAAELDRAGVPWSADDHALVEVFDCLVEAARAGELTEDELLGRGLRIWRERVQFRLTPPAKRHRIGEESMELPALIARLAPLVRDGIKPALSIRNVSQAEVDDASAVLQGLSHALAGRTLLIASSEELLRERLECAGDAERAAILEGVPACCARAWSQSELGRHDLRTWASLLSRSAALPTAIWIPALGFVPCSPGCAHADSTHARWLDALGSHPPTEKAWLFDFDGASLVGLNVTRATDQGLEYADKFLRVLPGQLLVQHAGKTVVARTATHGVWFKERTWHDAEWRELARGVALAADEASHPVAARRDPGGRSSAPRNPELERMVKLVIERLGAGAALERAWFDAQAGTITMTLSLEGSRYELTLTPRRGEPCLLQTEHFSVTYSRDTPLNTREHVQKVELICAGLDRVLNRTNGAARNKQSREA